MQPFRREFRSEWLEAEGSQQGMRGRIRSRKPVDDAEAPGVGIAQNPIVEGHIHMIVPGRRRPRCHEVQIAGHPQVDDKPAAAGLVPAVEEQVLAPPLHIGHEPANQRGCQIRRHLPAQPGLSHDDTTDEPPLHVRQHPPPTNLDFRQFRHLVPPGKPQ